MNRVLVTLLAPLLLSACANNPLEPATQPGPTVVPYIIDFGNAAKAAQYQAAFPRGITGMSPQGAAVTFGTPLGGQTPGLGFMPPGIWLPATGLTYDTAVASGTIPTGYTTDGTHYPDNTFIWLGVFAR